MNSFFLIIAALTIAAMMLALLLIRSAFSNPSSNFLAQTSGRYTVFIIIMLISGILIVLGKWAISEIETRVKEVEKESLQAVLQSTHESLLNWHLDRSLNIEARAEDPYIRLHAENLLSHPAGSRMSEINLEALRILFRRDAERLGILGFFVITPDGLSVGSMRDSNIGSTNLIYQYRPEMFARALQGETVFIPPIPSDVGLPHAALVSGMTSPPSMFFATPVFSTSNKILGVMTIRLDTFGRLASIMKSGRIGRTGETYLFDYQGRIMNESRFPDQLTELGLTEPYSTGIYSLRLTDPGKSRAADPGVEQPDSTESFTLMAASALSEQSGYNTNGYRDYRGKKVIGAWLWDEDLQLGLATEMEYQEAMQTTRAASFVIPVVIGFAILLVVSTSFMVLRSAGKVNDLLRENNIALEERVRTRTADLEVTRDEALTSQKMLQDVVDNVNAIVFMKDLQGRHLIVNTVFEETSGFSKDQVLGKTDLEFYPPDIAKRIMDDDQEVMTTGNVLTFSEQVTLPDGSQKAYWTHKAALRDSHQKIVGMVGFATDISELKKTELELVAARKQAEEATAAKGLFLANMSHEIRTPLNGIMGLTNLCLRTDLSDKQQHYLQSILFSAESLLRIINDLLDFSKIEAGRLEIEHIAFSLDDIFDHVRALLSRSATDKGLDLLFECKGEVLQTYMGDPVRIGQVLLNLTSNAIKFTEQGNVLIKVTVLDSDANRSILEFQVKDTGIGLTEAQQEKLFKPFTQADASTSRQFGGTGLGLAICKKLVTLMEGNIRLESKAGKGSVFSFTLPLHKQGSHQPPSLKNRKILIVEDDPATRHALGRNLEGLGADINLVSDGLQALNWLSDHKPCQAMITDWRMPGMSGLELLQQIASKPELKPGQTLVLTAYAEDIDPEELKPLGVSTILQKPVTPSQLIDSLITDNTDLWQPHRQYSDTRTELNGIRIILAEDNEVNLEIATEILREAGAELMLARNGVEAVNLAMQNDWDLLLMDIQMPVMDGCEATRHIRENPEINQAPIIALTANVLPADVENYLSLGMNAHVGKPINFDQLFSVICEQLVAEGIELNTLKKTPGLTRPLPGEIFIPPEVSGIHPTDPDQNFSLKPSVYLNALRIYIRAQKEFGQRLDLARQHQDNIQIREIIHALKGASGNLGIQRVFELAARLEQKLIQQETTRDEDFEQLKHLLADAIRDVEIILQANPLPEESVTITFEECRRELLEALSQSAFISDEMIRQFGLSAKGHIPPKVLSGIISALEIFDYDEAVHLLNSEKS